MPRKETPSKQRLLFPYRIASLKASKFKSPPVQNKLIFPFAAQIAQVGTIFAFAMQGRHFILPKGGLAKTLHNL